MTGIPPFGLGTYQNTDHDQCVESVRTALEVGYRHVDTAQGYGNEAAVGEGIERADVDREDVYIATKVSTSNLAYDDVIESTEASLERLGVDVVDLLYVHWPIRTYDAPETLRAFDDLVERGLVRDVGLSNFTPDLLDEAREILDAPIAAHQVECHPLLPQEELREYASEHGHALVAYSPIAKGEVLDIPELQAIAEDHDATPPQISLAWLRAKDAVVIPKATGRDHIEENWGAREIDLDESEIARIDDIDRRERLVDFESAPWR